jgi:hypothetical protein
MGEELQPFTNQRPDPNSPMHTRARQAVAGFVVAPVICGSITGAVLEAFGAPELVAQGVSVIVGTSVLVLNVRDSGNSPSSSNSTSIDQR